MSTCPPTSIRSAGSNSEKKKPSASIATRNDGHKINSASLTIYPPPVLTSCTGLASARISIVFCSGQSQSPCRRHCRPASSSCTCQCARSSKGSGRLNAPLASGTSTRFISFCGMVGCTSVRISAGGGQEGRHADPCLARCDRHARPALHRLGRLDQGDQQRVQRPAEGRLRRHQGELRARPVREVGHGRREDPRLQAAPGHQVPQ
eukprot:gene18878-26731_t